MASLSQYEKAVKKPYKSPYTKQLKTATNAVLNPADYQWDANKDTAYQSMRDDYLRNASQSARDVAAQASANSMGYGNSFGASAAGQMYRQAIENLGSVANTAEQNAYAQYNQGLQNNQNKLSLLQSLEDANYNRYQNDIANAQANRTFAYQQALNNRDFNYQKNQDKKLFDYNKEQDAYARAVKKNSSVSSGTSTSYKIPTQLRSQLNSKELSDKDKIYALENWGGYDDQTIEQIMIDTIGPTRYQKLIKDINTDKYARSRRDS